MKKKITIIAALLPLTIIATNSVPIPGGFTTNWKSQKSHGTHTEALPPALTQAAAKHPGRPVHVNTKATPQKGGATGTFALHTTGGKKSLRALRQKAASASRPQRLKWKIGAERHERLQAQKNK